MPLCSPVSLLLSEAFENRRDALTAADAHRNQSIAAADALELVQRLHRQDAAGCADGMAERDAGSVRIGLCRIKAQILRHSAGLGGKRLVALDHIDVGN